MNSFQEKIELAIENSNLEEFNFKELEIAGDICVLVTPKTMGATWNKYNIYLRSVIYRKSDYYPVSLGFFKYVNWGEKPDLFPPPDSLVGAEAILKCDGSLCIFSRYKGVNIIRSRGSDTIEHFANKDELEIFKQKYPLLFNLSENIAPTVNYSILTEWVSPKNCVVLKYENPELYLIGVVSHEDYSLFAQDYLDSLGKLYNLPRPEKFEFNSINDMLSMIKEWEGKEGVVLYFNKGQKLLKIKADKYLLLHFLKSEFSSLDKLIDLFISQGYPTYGDFFLNICNLADYEIASNNKDNILKICNAFENAKNIEREMEEFVEKIQGLTRKEQAARIISTYGQTGKSGVVFSKLDKKQFDGKIYKKLMFYSLD